MDAFMAIVDVCAAKLRDWHEQGSDVSLVYTDLHSWVIVAIPESDGLRKKILTNTLLIQS